jgi:hypothetical protein
MKDPACKSTAESEPMHPRWTPARRLLPPGKTAGKTLRKGAAAPVPLSLDVPATSKGSVALDGARRPGLVGRDLSPGSRPAKSIGPSHAAEKLSLSRCFERARL